jgi:ribonuclease E
MAKKMLIDALHPEETRVVIADDNQIYDFDFISSNKKQLKGNIYLAKVTRVEPSLQAAFVEYGGGKQGFLPFSEIHTDYYQIPVSDRERLMEEAARESENDDDDSAATETNDIDKDIASDTAENTQTEDAATADTSDDTSQEDEPQLEENTIEGDASHPAYLMQGAIDLSVTSDEIDPQDENTTIAGHTPSEAKNDNNDEHTAAHAENTDDTSGGETEKTEEVETLPNEEEEVESSRPRRNVFLKRYKIQEVIRRGQIVLVQVIKEERGNKGVSLTTYLSLAGRYCVLMPNSPKDGGISRKIASADDRKRLKAISTELKLAQGMSVIIRTAGMDRTRAEIKRDYDYLVKLWNQIREDTLKSTAPAMIYEESDIIKRAIRDQYSNDIDEVIIEGDEGYRAARDFMKMLLPSHTPKIKQYKDSTPLFYAHGNIEEQLLSMHDPMVKLKSGGYLVLNPTEALISVDVNSGRATTERNIEETAVKTNLEAAIELARQLRLRDLAGLIVIDFIDMLESRNRRAVEKALKDALKADRAKIQLGRISPFGLLEMSRQRLRSSISESNMVHCAHCAGRGVVRSNDSMSIQMIRAIGKEASAGTWSGLRLIAPQAIALHLLNTKRDALRAIEERYSVSLQVLINNDLPTSEFNLEKMRRSPAERNNSSSNADNSSERRNRRNRKGPPQQQDISDNTEEQTADTTENDDNITEVVDPQRDDTYSPDGNRRGRRRGRRGGRNRNDRPRKKDDMPDNENTSQESPEPQHDDIAASDHTANTDDKEKPARNRRSRGGRGRRRWRDEDGTRRADAKSDDGEAPSGETPKEKPDNVLPAFATQDPVPVAPPQPQQQAVAVNASSTPRDPNAPTKRGWWQKMIELDE